MRRKPGRMLKRAMDLTLTLLTMSVWVPCVLLLGLVVKLEDGKHIFYRRRVVGPDGEFDAFKLRTMGVDADQWLGSHPELLDAFRVSFKLKDDPRITRVGRFLRK